MKQVRRSLIQDKKGQMNQFSVFGIFTFMISALLVVLLFGGLIYIQGLLHQVFDQVGAQNEVNAGHVAYTNMSAASTLIWGTLDNSIQSLKMVAGVYLLAWIVCMIIMNALVKMHPMFFFVYILLSLLAIIFAVPISNAYQGIFDQNPFPNGSTDGILGGFTIPNFILINLPVVVLFLSVLGGIFLFVNLIRTQEAGQFQ